MANATKALATDDTAQKFLRAVERLPEFEIENPWYIRQNLLNNWYFEKPVNQRGAESYTGGTTATPVYGIDCWGVRAEQIRVVSGGIQIYNSSGHNFYGTMQRLENPEQYCGKTLTFSVLLDSADSANPFEISIASATQTLYVGTIIGGTSVETAGLASVTAVIPSTLPSTTLSCWIATRDTAVGAKCLIRAAKLEFGDTQTLAHQDADGNWILNEVPDYIEQLTRCQRYFQTFRTRAFLDTAGVNCRPVMRTASPTTGTISIDDTTYYTLSSEL